MDVNNILLMVTIFSALLLVFRVLRSPFPASRIWLYSVAIVALVTGMAFLFFRPYAGYTGLATTILFILVPMRGINAINKMVTRGDWAAARRLARVLHWLQPFHNWKQNDAFLQAQELATQGRMEEARALLASQRREGQPPFEGPDLYLYRLSGDWQGLLSWLTTANQDDYQKAPQVIGHHLRAQGEIGDLNGLLQTFERYLPLIRKVPGLREQCYLMAFAFCGRPNRVSEVIESPAFGKEAESINQFWLATAEIAAGEQEAARHKLEPLLDSDDYLMRKGAQRRLAQGLADPQQILTDESQHALRRIEQAWADDRPQAYTFTEASPVAGKESPDELVRG